MWLAAPVGKMKRILCSDWLTKRARWAQSCLLVIDRFDSARLQSTYRVRNFRMTARESQKKKEHTQNKGNIKRVPELTVLQKPAFFACTQK